MEINNTEKYKRLNSDNKNKLLDALSSVTGRNRISIRNHWFLHNSVPKEFQILVNKATDKVYKQQIKEFGIPPNGYTPEDGLKKLEKLLN